MANPWDKYKQPAAAPWAKYAPQDPRTLTPEQRAANVAANAGNQAQIDAMGQPEMGAPQEAPGVAATALLGATQGATFGFGDEIVARIMSADPNITYDQALQMARGTLDQGREANPGTALVSEIGGALAMPLGGMKSTGKLGIDMLKGAAAGAGLSGLYGFGAGEGGFQERTKDAGNAAIIGGMLGGAIPLAGAGIQKMIQGRSDTNAIRNAARNAPSTEDLRAAGNAAYRAVDDAGVQIKPDAFNRARSGIMDDLRANTGFDELPGPGSLTPNSARVNEIMGQASSKMAAEPTAALPFSAVDQMRRQAGAAAGNVTNKSDQKAGMSIISGLDDFINKLGPDDVVAGDVGALQSALPKARETWARMSKSQMVDDAIDAGGNYLSGASSGIRNQFRNMLKNPKTARSFSEAEQKAMRRVINGSIPEQLLNLAGGGLGQMATTISGGAMGGIPGLMAGGAAAAGARKLAEKVTTNKAEMVRALIANGGIKSLPQATMLPRQIIEQLMQRGTAAGLQQ